MGAWEGLGTELGLLNAFVYTLTLALLSLFAKRIKFLLTTDWEKFQKRHWRMWNHYIRQAEDTSDFSDIE